MGLIKVQRMFQYEPQSFTFPQAPEHKVKSKSSCSKFKINKQPERKKSCSWRRFTSSWKRIQVASWLKRKIQWLPEGRKNIFSKLKASGAWMEKWQLWVRLQDNLELRIPNLGFYLFFENKPGNQQTVWFINFKRSATTLRSVVLTRVYSSRTAHGLLNQWSWKFGDTSWLNWKQGRNYFYWCQEKLKSSITRPKYDQRERQSGFKLMVQF